MPYKHHNSMNVITRLRWMSNAFVIVNILAGALFGGGAGALIFTLATMSGPGPGFNQAANFMGMVLGVLFGGAVGGLFGYMQTVFMDWAAQVLDALDTLAYPLPSPSNDPVATGTQNNI